MLVRKTEGEWREWHGDASVTALVATFTAHFHDGRVEEMPCDPYPIERTLNGNRVAQLYREGVWTLAEVVAAGGAIAIPFEAPKGQRAVGEARYVEHDGEVFQEYDVEDIPPAPEPPTAEEKLAALGLTRAELRALTAEDAVQTAKR